MAGFNVVNLTAEERAQFRQIAGTVDTKVFKFDLGQETTFRVALAALLADDTVLMVSPQATASAPLDPKVKAAIFTLFDRARDAARNLQGGLSDSGNLLVFGAIGVVAGMAIAWLVGR